MSKYKVTFYVEYDKIEARSKEKAVELAWEDFEQDVDVIMDILQVKVKEANE